MAVCCKVSGTGKRIDFAAIAPVIGTLYPSPFDEPCRKRERRSDLAPLHTQSGNHLTRQKGYLAPRPASTAMICRSLTEAPRIQRAVPSVLVVR
jgi:hypothetical protein